MSKKIIGQEIEAYCGKCKLDTLHTITAVENNKIGKVMCKLCMSYHKYKKPLADVGLSTPVKKPKSPARKKRVPTSSIKKVHPLDEEMNGEIIDYNMAQNYEVDTRINHKSFGIGIVKNVVDTQKIQVIFRDKVRVLVQNFNR